MTHPALPPLAGLDGCKAGWAAAVDPSDGPPFLAVFPTVGDVLEALSADATVAVDMPIGLPDHTYGDGRPAEQAARPILRRRRSSLFSIPARRVVETYGGKCAGIAEIVARHKAACDEAEAHSTPPRRFAIQGFGLFPKIMEIDRLLQGDPALADRVIESHPEVALAVLNDGVEMRHPKKIKGRVNPEGVAERRQVLSRLGVPPALLEASLPRGVGEDDRLDACVMLLVARRYRRGEAGCFPDPPARDARALPVAIWV